ncbi:MAG: SMI1/KNR4 family protein [Myxococcota bacterium]
MSRPFDALIERRMHIDGLSERDFSGASSSEIGELEKALGRKLPRQYRAYLSQMGWEPGHAMRGSDIRFGCLAEINLELGEFARESGLDIPSDAIAIMAHQGYEYWFVRASEGDDPPVYVAREDRGIRRSMKTVSDWVEHLFAA